MGCAGPLDSKGVSWAGPKGWAVGSGNFPEGAPRPYSGLKGDKKGDTGSKGRVLMGTGLLLSSSGWNGFGPTAPKGSSEGSGNVCSTLPVDAARCRGSALLGRRLVRDLAFPSHFL